MEGIGAFAYCPAVISRPPCTQWMACWLLVGLAGCSGGEPPAAQPADAGRVVTVDVPDEREAAAARESAPEPTRTPAPAPAPAPAVFDAPPAAQQATPLPSVASTSTVVMDVMQVVGRTEAEVAALLGTPLSCAEIHRARLCKYGAHQDEVLFARGKADMITVQGMDAVAFNAGALSALGLPPARPDHANAHAIRWESIPGLVEVAVFPGPGQAVDFAYVKVGAH